MGHISLRRLVIPSLFLISLLTVPARVFAQDATITGTITDATGGILPGVTVTATHEATGNTFVGVTDQSGVFKLPVRTGPHRVTAELPGFATVMRTVDLLVRQTAVLNLQLSPSTVQESVTVTGEAPLIDTVSSTVGANVDPRQMQDLPLNGRNWIDLTMLAPGSRQNTSSDTPMGGAGNFQLNIDGQEVTNNMVQSFGQPKFSRDSIAEFEFVSNRFDASQGRSMGVQINAITKSGTNIPVGTFSGYFRDDTFIAKDFVQNRVLPYSGSATERHLWRPDQEGSHPLLRQLRIRTQPGDIQPFEPVVELQLRSEEQQHREEGWHPARLPVHVTDAVVVPRQLCARALAARPAILGWRDSSPVHRHRGRPPERQRHGQPDAGAGQKTINEIKGGYSGYRGSRTRSCDGPTIRRHQS